MYKDKKIWLAQSDKNLFLLPNMANRHGLIAGATGTGKTITMKVMAESFSDMGVPVFMADVKGDVSGMCVPGADSADMRGRIERFGIEGFEYKSYPTRFWDIFGEQGHPVRVTISDMGPVLLARLLGLTDVQAGVLNIVFKVADEHGLLLLDMKDLRAMLQFVGDNRAEFTTQYGNVSAASIGAIQRALLAFEDEGGEIFFGEPALDIRDWMRTDADGRGYINILSSARLIQSPKVYGTFLLWMLTELFERLPKRRGSARRPPPKRRSRRPRPRRSARRRRKPRSATRPRSAPSRTRRPPLRARSARILSTQSSAASRPAARPSPSAPRITRSAPSCVPAPVPSCAACSAIKSEEIVKNTAQRPKIEQKP